MRPSGDHLLVSALAVLTITLTACGGAAPTQPPPTALSTSTEALPPTETPATGGEAEAPTPSVVVSDQEFKDGRVIVDRVVAAEPGWIVIHADQDGAPGPVVGYAPVEKGTNENVEVQIDPNQPTPKLFAMLHVDSGEMGTYEFPDGDPPVKLEGQIVVTPFNVKLPAAGVSVAKADSTLGAILVNAEGMTLYLLTQDNQGGSTCTGTCARNWPPLLTEGQPQAGEGVDSSLLGVIERPDGSTQATYDGWPLYSYSRDLAPGDTNGQGVNGVWFVFSPDDQPAPESETDSGGGGLYGY